MSSAAAPSLCPAPRLPPGTTNYFFSAGFTPRSASASFAVFSESACLPPSCCFCASSSFAVACFTFWSSVFFLAAASRPSLMTFGHELVNAEPDEDCLRVTCVPYNSLTTIIYTLLLHHHTALDQF